MKKLRNVNQSITWTICILGVSPKSMGWTTTVRRIQHGRLCCHMFFLSGYTVDILCIYVHRCRITNMLLHIKKSSFYRSATLEQHLLVEQWIKYLQKMTHYKTIYLQFCQFWTVCPAKYKFRIKWMTGQISLHCFFC